MMTEPGEAVAVPANAVEFDQAMEDLRHGSRRWADLSARERGAIFSATHHAIGPVAQRWAETAAVAKLLRPTENLAAEEWMSGPYAALIGAARFARTFADFAEHGTTLSGTAFGPGPGGRVAVQVLPQGLQEWVLFNGFRIDVWSRPGVTQEDLQRTAGLAARSREPGGVALVLGAGNISAIGPLDVFYEIAAHNRACLLKLNPTFQTLLLVYQQALKPLIDADLLRIVNGDGAVGAYLTQHPGIDKVHITGAAATHDLIVWGSSPEAERRKAAGAPLLTTEITSELGGVSPVIVVPGSWSTRDLRHQAEHVATMRLHNCGHNCVAAQTVIVSSDWPQKGAFLRELRGVLDHLPAREPWYPGTEAKLEAARAAHPDAEDHRGRLLIEVPADLPNDIEEFEYFGPILGVTKLPGTGREFLHAAVDFANDRLAGTLGANVLIAPRDRRALGGAFLEEIARLRYGTVAINAWTAVGFLQPAASWGAFPGHTLDAVGSGIGVVHNGHLIADPERTVVSGPFRTFPFSVLGGEFSLFPRPPWFITARHSLQTARRLTAYAIKPGGRRIASVLAAAFRG